LLDKENLRLDMTKLGFEPESLVKFEKAILKPYGMVLVTGPTGSGKTNTLYSAISTLNKPNTNIMTAEDPVEFQLMGVNQVQMKEQIGLNFAAALRAFLRQDPNIILVGEIRDFETAEIAIKAALTGHLVLSTLHTNGAPETITRLMNMGIEPFLIASTVHTVIGQRLVRRLGAATETYQSDAAETAAIREALDSLLPTKDADMKDFANDLGYETLPLATQNAYTLSKGIDSPSTPGGYKGRMGVYEVFNITEEIQELILKRATSAEIQKVAQAQGMVSMREDGYLKALAGYTTLTEVNRVASADSA
jgi:type IV pilus assembly protein PilB